MKGGLKIKMIYISHHVKHNTFFYVEDQKDNGCEHFVSVKPRDSCYLGSSEADEKPHPKCVPSKIMADSDFKDLANWSKIVAES